MEQSLNSKSTSISLSQNNLLEAENMKYNTAWKTIDFQSFWERIRRQTDVSYPSFNSSR